MAENDMKITNSVWNRNQSHKSLQKHYIRLTDSDHYHIIDEIKRRDTVEYQRDMSVDDN